MMSSNRAEYSSATEWLEALREDGAWLCQLQHLKETAAGDNGANREDALRRIGCGDTYEFWDIYQHQVEPVVKEVWEIRELSLPKLKIQTIGMLSIEWLEQHADSCKNKLPDCLSTEDAMKYWQRLQEAGLVDANYQLMPDTTRKQAMYIAELFAEQLGIKSKWKTFEQLWGISNLAQEKWDMQETGTAPTRSKDIDRIFSD